MNGLPEVRAQRAGADTLELDLVVTPDGAWFDGHFPGHPILPGVVQIGWAAHFAQALLGSDTPPMQFERVKFRRPVGPAAQLTLSLRKVGAKVHWQFVDTSNGAVASSGLLALAPTL